MGLTPVAAALRVGLALDSRFTIAFRGDFVRRCVCRFLRQIDA